MPTTAPDRARSGRASNTRKISQPVGQRMAARDAGRACACDGRPACRVWVWGGMVEHWHSPELSSVLVDGFDHGRGVGGSCSRNAKGLRASLLGSSFRCGTLAARSLPGSTTWWHVSSACTTVQPVTALKAMRHLAGDRGAVLVVDERVGEAFTAAGNDVEWMMYGWSILHCLPVGKADAPSAETGAVMRPGTLRRYAEEAGFRRMEILAIDNLFFRLYRLHA